MTSRLPLQITTVAAIALIEPAFAYQFEVGGSLGRDSYEGKSTQVYYESANVRVSRTNSFDNGETTIDLFGTAYAEEVTTQNGPRAEYGFLSKTSYAYGGYANDAGNAFTVGGRYIIDKVNGYLIDAEAVIADDDSYESDRITVGGGLYLTPTSTVIGRITSEDNGDDNDLVFGGEFRSLLTLTNDHQLAVDAELQFGDYFYLGGSAEYFLTDDIGVGGGFGRVDGDDSEGFILSLFGSYFVIPEVEVFADLSRLEDDFDNGNLELFSITLGANYRL